MIDIRYDKNININIGRVSEIFPEDKLPLTLKIKNVVSKEIVWETKLSDNMWATFPDSELKDVIVEDSEGKFIYRYRWDVLQHGSIFHKSLWLYCKSLINRGVKPIGLAVGTHDGEFGEWVPLILNFMSETLLVEASLPQYNKLKKNYFSKSDVSFLNSLVTTDGSDVEFFEGGRGYTNSVVKRVIEHWETEEITSSVRPSISFNELLKDNFDRKIDWLHLDVEGLDSELLRSVSYDLLPNFIIFEDFNLSEDEKTEIYEWLKFGEYKLHSQSGICMATKSI